MPYADLPPLPLCTSRKMFNSCDLPLRNTSVINTQSMLHNNNHNSQNRIPHFTSYITSKPHTLYGLFLKNQTKDEVAKNYSPRS